MLAEPLDPLGHDEVEREFDKFVSHPSLDLAGLLNQDLVLPDPFGLLLHVLVHLLPDLLQSLLVLLKHTHLLIQHFHQIHFSDVRLQHLVDVLFFAFLELGLPGDVFGLAGDGMFDCVLVIDQMQISPYFLSVLVEPVLSKRRLLFLIIIPLL